MVFSPKVASNLGMNFKITPLIQEIEKVDGDRMHNNKSTENQTNDWAGSKRPGPGGDNLHDIFKATMNEKPRP